jgi:hypothetical protein
LLTKDLVVKERSPALGRDFFGLFNHYIVLAKLICNAYVVDYAWFNLVWDLTAFFSARCSEQTQRPGAEAPIFVSFFRRAKALRSHPKNDGNYCEAFSQAKAVRSHPKKQWKLL